MKPEFKALFSFSKKEVALFFVRTSFAAQINGMKLLAERTHSAEQTGVNHGKILIIASRKVGKACLRNRLRRQIKAIYYEEKLSIIPQRFALICYPQATKLSFNEIKAFLTSAIRKLDK